MALIKRSEADAVSSKAVVFDLGDLRREGDMLIAEARSKAASIIEQAKAERERLVKGSREIGYDVGYNKGLAEGITKGQEQGIAQALESASSALSSLAESWGLAVSRFEADRERMIAEARSDIVKLAAVFAERVTRRAVSLDASVVERQIEAVLRAAIRPTRLTIAVHPEDKAQAERALPGLLERLAGGEHAELVADASLERGSCVARMSGGAVLDASISGQIDRLVAEMMPGEETPAGPADGAGGGAVDEGDGA